MYTLFDLLLNLIGCLIYNHLFNLLFRNIVLISHYYIDQSLIIIIFYRILIIVAYMTEA